MKILFLIMFTLSLTLTFSSSVLAVPDTRLVDKDFGKKITVVNADTLTLFSEKRKFIYEGNVTVVQGDMTMESELLEGNYTETNEIETLVAKKNVHIIKGEGIEASSQRADYNSSDETLLLTEDPEINQKDSILTADQVKIFLNEDRSVAEGDVRVKMVQAETEIKKEKKESLKDQK